MAGVKENQPKQIVVIESFGKVVDIQEDAGCYFYPRVCCTKEKKVPTALLNMRLMGSSIPDRNGSPMVISALMNYQVKDAIAYAYSVDDPYRYLENQGAEVLRRVCAKFPYLSNDGPSISKNSNFLGDCLRELTQ